MKISVLNNIPKCFNDIRDLVYIKKLTHKKIAEEMTYKLGTYISTKVVANFCSKRGIKKYGYAGG